MQQQQPRSKFQSRRDNSDVMDVQDDLRSAFEEGEAPPRIISQMRDRNEAAATALALADNRQENISLTTRRDIRCFVMTEAELNSLLIASALLSLCSSLPAIVLLVGLCTVVYNPIWKDIVAAAVLGVVTIGFIGGIIAHYWRNSIVNAIRNGANFDAQR